MRFSAILFLLGLKLRWSAWSNGDFRKRLRRLNRVVVIRTEDGRQARSYVFRNDSVHIQGGIHPEATVELVWADPDTAIKAMLSGNPLDNFSAIGRGDLSINGNLQDALWFSDFVQ
jgi:hypothetical protein